MFWKMSEHNNFNEVKDRVLAMVKIAPRSTSDLAKLCGFASSKSFYRDYLTKFVELNLVEKLSGSNLWNVKGFKMSQNKLAEVLSSDVEFYNTEVIKNWRDRNTSKYREMQIECFKSICMGTLQRSPSLKLSNQERERILKIKLDFKINPDTWQHDYDTKRVIKALKAFYETNELDNNRVRMTLRSALLYGMKVILTTAEAEALGISGKTDKATLSTLHMTKPVYNNILADTTIDNYHKMLFFFSYATFFRPSTRYVVKCEDIQFYDREVKYVQLRNGHKITRQEDVDNLNEDNPEKYPINIFKHRAAMVHKTTEFKTEQIYPKYVWHESFVNDFEKYVNSRIHQGYKYLFWNDNKTEFDKNNYDKIVKRPRSLDNKYFANLFFRNGFKTGDFGKQDDANYALRHFGVQEWLMITNYDYGKIKGLGWEDINTLIKWYGQRPAHIAQKEFAEIIF